MTNDKADFTGKHPEKTGCIYDAGSWSLDPAGCVWCS